MAEKKIHVPVLLADGQTIEGVFTLEYSDPWDEHAPVTLKLKLPRKKLETKRKTFFEAMQAIRLQLEPEGIALLCNGACENVAFIEILTADDGRYAHVLKLGEQPKKKNSVDIFAFDPTLSFATVQEQETFYQAWLESL